MRRDALRGEVPPVRRGPVADVVEGVARARPAGRERAATAPADAPRPAAARGPAPVGPVGPGLPVVDGSPVGIHEGEGSSPSSPARELPRPPRPPRLTVRLSAWLPNSHPCLFELTLERKEQKKKKK